MSELSNIYDSGSEYKPEIESNSDSDTALDDSIHRVTGVHVNRKRKHVNVHSQVNHDKGKQRKSVPATSTTTGATSTLGLPAMTSTPKAKNKSKPVRPTSALSKSVSFINNKKHDLFQIISGLTF